MAISVNVPYHINGIEQSPPGYCKNLGIYSDEMMFTSSHTPISRSELGVYLDISHCLSSAKKSLPKGGNLTDLLTHLVSNLLHFYDKDREYYRILLQQMLFAEKNSDSLLVKLHQEQITFLTYIIELSKNKKKVSFELDAHEIASTIFLMYTGLLITFTSNPEMTVDETNHIFSSSIKLLHNGIKRKEAMVNRLGSEI